MIFGWRRKKKKREKEPEQTGDSLEQWMEQSKDDVPKIEKINVDISVKSQRLDYINRLYEGILEAKRLCLEVKAEYGQVTSYLKDIQLIDQALPEESAAVRKVAGEIAELTEDRERRKKIKYKFTDAQKDAMEREEGKVAKDVEHLKEYEDYQIKIKHDMRQLNGEKHMLAQEKQDILKKQSTLRLVSKTLGVILALLGILMIVVMTVYEVDIRIPFIATVIFALIVAFIIVIEARKNRTDMVITEKKSNRAIFLLNRVKIKYVNNTKTIDYMCAKYRVKNGTELEFVWGQYCRARREWARLREVAFILNEKNERLIELLAGIGVKDREIWIYQAKALVDPREMVEVRHELNERRQKLREQIEYNTQVMQEFLGEMERIRNKKPEYQEEVEQVLRHLEMEGEH